MSRPRGNHENIWTYWMRSGCWREQLSDWIELCQPSENVGQITKRVEVQPCTHDISSSSETAGRIFRIFTFFPSIQWWMNRTMHGETLSLKFSVDGLKAVCIPLTHARIFLHNFSKQNNSLQMGAMKSLELTPLASQRIQVDRTKLNIILVCCYNRVFDLNIIKQ